MATYFYLFNAGRSVGGPYATLEKLAAGVRRSEQKDPRRKLEPRRLVDGRWGSLTESQGEALLALVRP